MTRPIYEEETDRIKEQEVADLIARKWARKVDKVVQMPKLFPCDMALVKDQKVVAFVEVKSRSFSRHKYDDLMFEVKKSATLFSIATITDKPMFIVCDMTDCVLFTQLQAGYPCIISGRGDRDDSEDIQPQFLIPLSQFQMLHDKTNTGEK